MIKVIDCTGGKSEKDLQKFLNRTRANYENVQKVVEGIVWNVRKEKNKALFQYTKEFDGYKLTKNTVKVTEKEMEEARKEVSKDLIALLGRSAERIRSFHNKQKGQSWFDYSREGEVLGQLLRPIEKAGVYVPGGKAAYPSSVLMNVIPAFVAGVENIIMVTPVSKSGKVNPVTLVAASLAGVKDIYKVGGAQAIAALAFGTETIPKVDKIVGPGNIYVALAKRLCFGDVNIDSIAGPSEILVIADETATPKYVAADMLSQAEHDEMASCVLVTTSKHIANKVETQLKKQSKSLSRKKIIEKALKDNSAIIIVENLDQAVTLSNQIAPEHLEICTAQPFDLLSKVKHAGAVFLGHFTPEPLGDYMAGPNHVLPTGGTARFFSPLSVDDFVKKSSVLSFDKEALARIGPDTIQFAQSEGFTAHANAVKVRIDD